MLGVLIYLVTTQVLDVAQKTARLPEQPDCKSELLRMSNDGPIGRAVQTIKDVTNSLEKPETPGRALREAGGAPKTEPLPVQVVPSASQTVASAGGYLGPILSPLGSAVRSCS
jgi:hypothetical protein